MPVLRGRGQVVVARSVDSDFPQQLSVIVPVLNDEAALRVMAEDLLMLKRRGHQIIIVDGGSIDGSIEVALSISNEVIRHHKGRATQMNRGAQQARHKILWFLHADSRVPEFADRAILAACLKTSDLSWGRCNIRIQNEAIIFRIISFMMNLRSCWTGVVTGDQAIFVSRSLFEQCGGYPEIALMEDIGISKKLRKRTHPLCLKVRVTTSARRWEQNGVFRTVIKMWMIRFLYFIGINPDRLHHWYYAEN